MHTLLIAAAIFSFQNNFWVNLHQFLHAEALRRAAGRPVQLESSLVDGYAAVAKRDLMRDAALRAVNDALAEVEGDVLPATIDPTIAAALTRAAPVYRATLWPQHRQANEAWIAKIRPVVDRIAPALTEQLAKAYHTKWPMAPILIDVSVAAGAVGGYTTLDDPPGFAGHSTISSVKEGVDDDMAVEIVFHEASHTVGPDIMRLIASEAGRQGVRTPPNLWHALIFYTSGELVRQALDKVGDSHYMPYAYRFDVYERGMVTDRVALERDWQPWLDGKVAFEEALRALVKDAR